MTRNRMHKLHMEQESIIEEMADAMRKAYLPYVADSGRRTPRMDWIWFKYVQFATKAKNEKI